ncbi:replication initiation and membrane attachment family protein [Desertibacillus haloalkaliphilus]|uniref:replication initiation and membrane attachment family protein n=1 Tax=Desertibacillus haloalkaliphilus TaxID=1328930 RepID=UPI001C25C98B|nr:replication initiation and membrane attachment family protein [Desertibacillus haloalkaliphilus]MBU8905140.1 replication initiation and membrane attachment family protein [Desertibacillus haloalkaliphilus]
MNWHWKHLLPVDRYTVRTVDHLTDLDQKVLTLLYQPLIGALAYSLYMTLFSQLERDSFWSDDQTHRGLMTMMGMDLDAIFEERKKLEAIGLVKTYKKTEEDATRYLYELQPPMSPQHFFTNDVLSVYLYNRLGKSKYRATRERFMVDKLNKDEYEEVTHGFDEVFSSLHHSEIIANHQSELTEAISLDKNKDIITRNGQGELVFAEQAFDFDLLLADLSDFVASEAMLTPEVKDAIIRLAFVYRIEPLEMSKIVQQAAIHDDEISVEELRKRVQEWYRIEYGNEPPSLALRTQPADHRLMDDKVPVTEEEKMIKLYETTSPLSLLENRSDGAKVPLPDVKLVEGLLLDYQLLPGVANVLIDYILKTNDMKLTKPLVDKIAGHWSRKNMKTVSEAMEFAKREYRRTLEWKQNKGNQPKRSANRKQNVRKDKLPKWFNTEEQGQQPVQEEKDDGELQKEKERFELLMNQLRAQKKKKEE